MNKVNLYLIKRKQMCVWGGGERWKPSELQGLKFCFLVVFFKPCVSKTGSQQELFRHFTGRRLTGWREATSRRPENSRLCRGGTAKHGNRKGARPGEAWRGRCRDSTGSTSGREEPRWRKWWVELHSIRNCFKLRDQIVWVHDWYCMWAPALPCSATT